MTALGNNSLTSVIPAPICHLRETAIVHVIDKMASCWDVNIKTKSYKYVKPPHEDQRVCLNKTLQETDTSWGLKYFRYFF